MRTVWNRVGHFALVLGHRSDPIDRRAEATVHEGGEGGWRRGVEMPSAYVLRVGKSAREFWRHDY
jgi:hypothetical protein